MMDVNGASEVKQGGRRWMLWILIPGLLAVSPLFFGYYAKTHIQRVLAFISESNAVHITLVDFKLGFFKSTATSKISLNGDEIEYFLKKYDVEPESTKTIEILVKHEIDHGPIFWDDEHYLKIGAVQIRSVWDPADSMADLQKDPKGKHPSITMLSTVLLGGGEVHLVQSKAINFDLGLPDSKIHYSAEAAQMTFILTGDNNEFQVQIKSPGHHLKIDHAQDQESMQVDLKDLQLDWIFKRHDEHYWFGRSDHSSIGKIEFTGFSENTSPFFSLSNLDIQSECAETEKNIALLVCENKGKFDELIFGTGSKDDQHVGPLNLSISFENVPMHMIARENILSYQITDEEQMKLLKQYVDAGPRILMDDFNVRFPDGDIRMSMDAKLDAGDYHIDDPASLQQAMEKHFYLMFNLQMPRKVALLIAKEWIHQNASNNDAVDTEAMSEEASDEEVAEAPEVPDDEALDKQADELIYQWVKEGILNPKGPDYTIDLKIMNGGIKVNDQVMTPETLQQDL